MVAEGFDLSIRFGEPLSSSLVSRRLVETRILTVAAPAYIKARGKPATPQELQSGGHTCIQFRDPQTGRPFTWDFKRRRKQVSLRLDGPLLLNDVGTMHSACLAGFGVAQVMELGVEHLLAEGRLIHILSDWADERFPLYAFYPSRSYLPAKTRAFLDFVLSITGQPTDS